MEYKEKTCFEMKHELKRNWLMFDFETWKLVIVDCITDFEEEKEKAFWVFGLMDWGKSKRLDWINDWFVWFDWLFFV